MWGLFLVPLASTLPTSCDAILVRLFRVLPSKRHGGSKRGTEGPITCTGRSGFPRVLRGPGRGLYFWGSGRSRLSGPSWDDVARPSKLASDF